MASGPRDEMLVCREGDLYDCEFVALADSMDTALVTQDARILREFRMWLRMAAAI